MCKETMIVNPALTDERIDCAAGRFLSGQFAIVSMMMNLYGQAEALIGFVRIETDAQKLKTIEQKMHRS